MNTITKVGIAVVVATVAIVNVCKATASSTKSELMDLEAVEASGSCSSESCNTPVCAHNDYEIIEPNQQVTIELSNGGKCTIMSTVAMKHCCNCGAIFEY